MLNGGAARLCKALSAAGLTLGGMAVWVTAALFGGGAGSGAALGVILGAALVMAGMALGFWAFQEPDSQGL